jgi:hypothetical protein
VLQNHVRATSSSRTAWQAYLRAREHVRASDRAGASLGVGHCSPMQGDALHRTLSAKLVSVRSRDAA